MSSNHGANEKAGPAWGLHEQLRRRGIVNERARGKSTENPPKPDIKSRLSISGASLAHKIQEHFRKDYQSNRELLGFCAQEVDKALSVMVQRVKTKLVGSVEKMEKKLEMVEINMRRLCAATEEKGQRMLRDAKRTADAEREEKAILCQWLNGFLISTSSEPQLSSMDFTLARFALNIAMTSNRTRPEAMLDAGAPAFLVSMLSNPNELVTGPAVMALAQMAHHDACQHALVLAGTVPPLVQICFTNQSPAVLTQACIALSVLSQHIPNKPIVAAKRGVAAMVQLLGGFRVQDRVTVQVAGQALAGLVNVMYMSDANRSLAEECGMTSSVIRLMDTVDDDFLLVQACRTLANISFGNQYTALRLLEAGADRAACDLVRDSDKTSHSDIMEAGFVALANMANNALNQAHVGAGSAIELAIAVCKHCESPRVVRAAALALCSLTLKCQANMTRCAGLDAVPTLMDLAAAWGTADKGLAITGQRNGSLAGSMPSSMDAALEEEHAAAAQAICCIAILMKHPTNALAMKGAGGLRQMTELIQDSEHSKVQTAAAKVVISIIPEPDAIVREARSGRISELEEACAYEALERVKDWVFGRKVAPSWLVFGLDLLSCDIDAIEARFTKDGSGAFRKPEELFTRSDFFREFETRIPPDVTLSNDEDFGGMLFHVF